MNNERYRSISMTLHWLMFFIIVAVYACIELRELYPKGSDPREALKAWHFTLGLSVFVLIWIRVVARVLTVTPPIEPSLPTWQTWLSKAVHLALYVFMIGMPLGGWLILSGEGKAIPFYGFSLPALIQENKPLAESIEEIHETVGTIGYFLIGLHVLAGLFHHYIRRDNTLIRMLPKALFK
jgi:cytochrome b561